MTVSAVLAGMDAERLVDAAVAGLGILLTTDWYVGHQLRTGRLVEVLAGWPVADRGAVYVVTPAAAGTPSKTRAFSDWVAEKVVIPP